MKNLSTKDIKIFKESGYSFEDIESINRGLNELDEGKGIPFSEILYNYYSNKNKQLCTK